MHSLGQSILFHPDLSTMEEDPLHNLQGSQVKTNPQIKKISIPIKRQSIIKKKQTEIINFEAESLTKQDSKCPEESNLT